MKSGSEMIRTETEDDAPEISLVTGNKAEELKALVENMVNVSTIPTTLKKVIEVVGDEKSSTSDLVKVIGHDQSLASRIIAVSNSAFYGFRGQVKSIPHAAVILGFDMVRNLAVSVSLFKSTNSLKYLEKLWIHAFKVATASSLLADRTGLVKKEDAFLAGLINDLGRVILYQLYGDEYIRASSAGRGLLLEREEEAFGATHSMVGKWFADSYKFQKDCVFSIEAHHTPERYLTNYRTGSLQIIPLVYFADMIVSEGEEGFEFDLTPSPNHAEIMEAVYLDEAGLQEVKEALSSQEDVINTFYND
jgi:HD-like signal output (HDOD) protein